jgi:membrane protease YdiL (CAAX protease family)
MENKEQSPVSVFEASLVIVATFFIFLFISAIVLFTVGEATALIVGEVLILLVPLLYLLIKQVDVKKFANINLKPKFVLSGIGLAIAMLLLNIIVSAALVAIFGPSQTVEESNQRLANLSSTTPGLFAVSLSLVLAGICEEFAFRGFLQSALTKKYSFLPAVMISAAIFGIFHLDLQLVYTLAAFISGLALGYIYHRWGYITSATAHATMNLIVLALLLNGI